MLLYSVFGNPISHSKSPILHNYVFYKLGIYARYTKHLLDNENNFKNTFLDFGYMGANITLPFKESVIKYCDEIRGIAKKIKAINTIVKENNKLIGYNTDADGFYKCIANENINNALVIGAGGSAKAITFILQTNNIDVTIVNRSKEKLEFFIKNGFKCFDLSSNPIITTETNFDLIINATSSSLSGILPIRKNELKHLFLNAKVAFDIAYGNCKFLELAKEFNINTIDGKKMLLYQAIESSSLFLNMSINKIGNIMSEIYPIAFK